MVPAANLSRLDGFHEYLLTEFAGKGEDGGDFFALFFGRLWAVSFDFAR